MNHKVYLITCIPTGKKYVGITSRSVTERFSKKVRIIETGGVFDSISDACRKYGLSSGNVGMVLSGKRNHCHGMRFEYV